MRVKTFIVTGLGAAALAYMGLLTWLNLRRFEDMVGGEMQRNLLAVAQARAGHVGEIVHAVQSRLLGAADSAAATTNADGLAAAAQDLLARTYEPMRESVAWVALADAQGRTYARLPNGGEHNAATADAAISVPAAVPDGFFVSGSYQSPSGERLTIVDAPVMRNGTCIGHVRAAIDADAILRLVGQTGPGARTETWLVDDRGTILAHPEPELPGRSVFVWKLRHPGDERRKQAVLTGMLRGSEGVTSFVTDRDSGARAMMAWAPVSLYGRNWSLAVSKDYERDVASPLRLHSQNTFVMFGCFLAAVGVAGAAYYRLDRRRADLAAHKAIGRVNEQLQMLSAEREQSVAELHRNIDQLDSVIAAIPHPVYWKDLHGVYAGCNSAFARLAGCPAVEDVINKIDAQLPWRRETADSIVRCDAEILRTGISLLNAEISVDAADGRTETFLASKIPLFGPGRELSGLLAILTDVTLIRRGFESLRTRAELAGSFLAATGHGLLLADAAGTVTSINESLAALLGTTTQTAVGTSVWDLAPSALQPAVKSALEELRTGAEREPRRFLHPFGGCDVEVQVWPVLENDLVTAFVLTTAEVSAYSRQADKAQYGMYRKSRFLVSLGHEIRTAMTTIIGFTDLLKSEPLGDEQAQHVAMIDQSAAHLMHVADEIVNISKAESAEYGVAAPEARMDAQTAAAAAPAQVADAGAESQQPLSDTGTPTVLVADDVEENRMLIDVMLHRAGYRTVLCGNGREALELAQGRKFDLILMDIQMPGMDGLDATRAIRATSLNGTTPILAMTASVDRDDEIQCLSAGCDDYVRKPVKKDLILRKVWRFIQQARQLEQAKQGGDIVSFLADDPDYRKTIEMFVNTLPKRLEEMQEAAQQGQLKELAVKVHALKGLGGFAGFPIFTEKTRLLEETIRENEIEKIRAGIDELVALCRRTKACPNRSAVPAPKPGS